MAEDIRISELNGWLQTVLDNNCFRIEFASQDASFRRYFRVNNKGASYIAMDAPVDLKEFDAFVRIGTKFRQVGLNVPEIFAVDHHRGFALITDFGNQPFLDALNDSTADALYSDAIDSLVHLQQSTQTDENFLPPYCEQMLRSELELFREWYLKKNRQLTMSSEMDEILDQTFERLICVAQEQPKVWVHLDYHSRNLMVVPHHNPGIIDFQSAVYVPIAYDLVSLLRDCYIVWDQQQVEQWIDIYLERARKANVFDIVDRAEFLHWFDYMGLQRHIKVVGIFSRLGYRDNKLKFLDDIPTVMRYIQMVAGKYPEFAPLHQLITRLINS